MRLVALLSLSLWVASLAVSDSWGPPRAEHWSDDRSHVLKVRKTGRTWRVALKQRSTNGWKTLWDVPNPQGAPPVQAFVSTKGDFVVLRDRWHNVGYGKVLVFLGESGKELASYRLADLCDERSRLAFSHTASSIWWSVPTLTRLVEGENEFWITPANSDPLVFDVRSGQRKPFDGDTAERVTKAFELVVLSKLEGEEPWVGAIEASCLRSVRALPRLSEVFASPPSDVSHPEFREIVLRAMLRIDPVTAENSLKSVAPTLAENERAHLEAIVEESRWTPAEPGMLGFLGSPNVESRYFAMQEMVLSGGTQAIDATRRALSDTDPRMRSAAAANLAHLGEPSDGPALLLAAQADPGLAAEILPDLVRLKAPGVETFARRVHLDMSHPAYKVALLALAQLGDQVARSRIVSMIGDPARYPKPGPTFADDNVWGAEVLLAFVVEQKLLSARAPLERLVEKRLIPFDWQISVRGALAAMGSAKHLDTLRRVALGKVVTGMPKDKVGRDFARAEAIRWLGVANDRASADALRRLVDSVNVFVSRAAESALDAMGLGKAESQYEY